MALSHSPKIVTDGLVLCLDAADKRSYPGTGTTWTDRSANGNNGTLTNGPTFDSANGGSIVLDGTNDYISHPFSLGSPSSYTISFVAKKDTITSSYKTVLSLCSITYRVSVWHYPNGNVGFGNANGAWAAKGAIWTDTNNFHNISIVVFNSSSLTGHKLYFDGKYIDTYGNSDASGAWDGIKVGGSWNTFKGRVSQFLLYNKALNADEVLQNYNATRHRFGV